MKFRCDYVTNSSSSSFIISKRNVSINQLKALHDVERLAQELNLSNTEYSEDWDIIETDKFISGYTWMDNFNMSEFFDAIGISDSIVTWSDSRFDVDEFIATDSKYEDWKTKLKKIIENEE